MSAIFDLRTYRALLFFVSAVPLGIVAFVLRSSHAAEPAAASTT